MKKKVLIIQGPLISVGHSGETRATTWEVVHYNCIENIIKIYNDYSNLFDEIILSTWDDHDLDISSLQEKKIKILQLKQDDIPVLKVEKSEYRPSGMQNHFKSFFGTIKALDSIQDKNSIVVKMRTDNYIALDNLLSYLKKNMNPNKLYVPNLLFGWEKSWHIQVGDFYLAGYYEVMENFSSSIIADNFKNHFPNIHQEYIYKYAYKKFYAEQSFHKYNYFYYKNYFNYLKNIYRKLFIIPNTNISINQMKIALWMYKNAFEPLSYNIFKNMIWRGAICNKQYLKNQNNYYSYFSENYSDLNNLVIKNSIYHYENKNPL